MKDKGKILERLRKVLAMTSSTNANEARNAQRIAAKMMAEHGISESEIAVEQSNGAVEVVDERAYMGTSQRKWEYMLAQGIASAIGCEMYIVGRARKNYVHYYGLASEVALAQELHAILRKQARVTARKMATSRTSYLNGFGFGVYQNGDAIAKYRAQGAQTSTALMVVNDAVGKYAESLNLKPKRTRKSKVRGEDYERGISDGLGADLSGARIK